MGIRIEQIENLSQYIQSLISGTTNMFVPFTGAQMPVNLNTQSLTAGSFWGNNGRALLLATSTFAHNDPTNSIIFEITNLTAGSSLMGTLEFEIFRYIGKSYKFSLSTYIYQSSWHTSTITWISGLSTDITSIELIKHSTIVGKYYVRINLSTSMAYGAASASYLGSSNFVISSATYKFFRDSDATLDLTETNSTIVQTITNTSFARDPYVLNYNNLTNAPAVTMLRANSNAYLSGNITLTAGTNMSLTQSGNVITLSSANTTYTAGNGLTLSGTAFSLPVTQSGSGNVVSDVVSSASGITVTKGLTAMLTSHPANGITSTNINNWNTASGWGNHAGLYVLKTGDTMSGNLNFGHNLISVYRDMTGISGNWSRALYSVVLGDKEMRIGHFGDANNIVYGYFGENYVNTFMRYNHSSMNIGYRTDGSLNTKAVLNVGDNVSRTLTNTYNHFRDNAIFRIGGNTDLYGIHMGIDSSTGTGWIQGIRTDSTVRTYNLALNPNSGQVSVGYLTATQMGSHKLGVDGSIMFIGGSSSGILNYGANYHSSYTSRSLVDKDYVDLLVASSAVTQTRLRANSSAYIGGDITLSAGSNMNLTQSGNIITLSSTPNTDTTYTAGNGLTLTGTQFTLPVTQSGSGSFVTSVVSSSTGITVTKGDVPANSLVTSSASTGVTNVATTNTNTFLNIVRDGSSLGSSTQIQGAGATTITSDTAGKITISSTNTTYSAGTLALLTAGTDTSNRVWSAKILTDWLATRLINTYKQTIIPGFNSNSYIQNVILLCDLTNDVIHDNRYFEGEIYLKRSNTVLNQHIKLYVRVSKMSNQNNPSVNYSGDLTPYTKFGTVTYNNRKYFALIISGVSSNFATHKISGYSSNWSDVIGVPYLNITNTPNVVLNSEINESIVYMSDDNSYTVGETTFASYVESLGFKKRSSSDSYVLLGGGGHKLLSDFVQTTTRIRSNGNSYLSGDVTLTAGTNMSLTQSGNVITLSSANTTYTAGSGLTLSGSQFSLPVTVTGTGTYVQSVAQNANGITITMGTPPDTNTNTTYTAGSGLTLSGTQFSLPVTVSGTGSYVQNVVQTANGLTIVLGTPPNTDTNTTYTAGNGLTLSGTQFSLPVTQSGTGNFVTSVVSSSTGITVTKGGISWSDISDIPTLANDFSLRANTNAYISGEVTLSAGANVTLTQSGNVITLSSTPNTNTTYTAGNGLTLSGTVFSLPVTTTGSGNVVDSVVSSANGISVTKNTTAMTTSHAANAITTTNINNWNNSPSRGATGGNEASIRMKDTRSTNPMPSTDLRSGAWFDFKQTSTIGLSGLGQSTYAGSVTFVPYSDDSGNLNTAFTLAQSSNNLYFRNYSAANTWGAWNRIITHNNIGDYVSTYTAGSGLTLSGTQFSLPVTVTGTGSYVQSITQTANGITVTLGTPTDTNTTYTAGNGLTLTGTQFTLPVTTTGSGNVVDSVVSSANGISVTKNTTAMTTSHAANGITSTNINNWNTASGWGNHAGLYVQTSYLSGRAITSGTTANTKGFDVYYLQGSDKPAGTTDGSLINASFSTIWSNQMFSDWRTNDLYLRNQNNGTWGSWVKVYHSGNFATGTTAQYLRGDGSLATLPSSTSTRIRSNTNAYIDGDITLTAGANVSLTQSGNVITISSTPNTTYTAGSGLTLSGSQFSLPVTVTGTGTYVQSVTQNANGITITMGTPTDTNTTYTAGNGLTLTGTQFTLPVTQSGSGSFVTSVVSSSTGITVTKGDVPANSLVTSSSATGTANVATTNTNTYLNIVRDGASLGSSTQIQGAGATTITSDTAGKVTISSTNTTYSAGNGLTLSGTAFSLPVTQSGSGNVVDSVVSSANGISVTKNTTVMTTSHPANGITSTNISDWNEKFRTLIFVNSLDTAISSGIYRQETPSNDFWYTSTLNLNSSDGRQQLSISRDGSGMKFRGITSGTATNGWGEWNEVIHSGNISNYIGGTTTYLRANSNAYISGNITLSAGTNMSLTQSGNVITLSSTPNTTYSVATAAELSSFTNTSGRLISGQRIGDLMTSRKVLHSLGAIDAPSVAVTAYGGNGISYWGSNPNAMALGYYDNYGISYHFSGDSSWYHRLDFGTSSRKIDFWRGINTTTMTRIGQIPTIPVGTDVIHTGNISQYSVGGGATTYLRANSNAYISGNITLSAGTNMSLTQSGNVITLSSTPNTTYTAGNGLTLSGTQFSLPITISGTGSIVTDITQSANGITVTKGSTISTRIGVNGSNYTIGDINFVGDGNTSITKSGNTVTISSSVGSGGGSTVNTNHYNLENAVSPQLTNRVVGEYQIDTNYKRYHSIEDVLGITTYVSYEGWSEISKLDYFGSPLGVIPLQYHNDMILFKGYISVPSFFGGAYIDYILCVRWMSDSGVDLIWLYPTEFISEQTYLMSKNYGMITKVGKVIYDNNLGFLFFVDTHMG